MFEGMEQIAFELKVAIMNVHDSCDYLTNIQTFDYVVLSEVCYSSDGSDKVNFTNT